MKQLLWFALVVLGLSATSIGYLNVKKEEQQFFEASLQQRAHMGVQLIRGALMQRIEEARAMSRMLLSTARHAGGKDELSAQIRALRSMHPGMLLRIQLMPEADGTLPAMSESFDPPLLRSTLKQARQQNRHVMILPRSDQTWVLRYIDWTQNHENRYVISDWNLQGIVYQSLAKLPDDGIHARLTATQQDKNFAIFETFAQEEGDQAGKPWSIRQSFDVEGIRFHLELVTLKPWPTSGPIDPASMVFLLGLLVMLAFALVLIGRNRYIDDLNRRLRRQANMLTLQRGELEATLNHVAEAILVANENGDLLGANTRASLLLGYAPSSWNGLKLEQLFSREDWPVVQRFLQDAEDMPEEQKPVHAITRTGKRVPCSIQIARFRAGQQVRLAVTLRDMSKELMQQWLHQTMLQIRQVCQKQTALNERLQQLFGLLKGDPWEILNGEAALYLVEKGALKLNATSPDWSGRYESICPRMQGRPCLRESHAFPLLHAFDTPRASLFDTHQEHGHHLLCLEIRHQGALLAIMHMMINQPPSCMLEEFSSFLAHLEEALALMISSHRSEEELIRLSYYDALTGLPNRRLFLDRLHHAIALARREREKLAVLYMDLNRFKPINDTLGHEAGDEVLRECAKRFRRFLRESDTAARLGGDEFAVLLPKTNAEMALNVAKKLLFSLQEPIRLARQEVTIGTSIGIASYPDDGEQAETLLKHADAAMYRAKKNHAHIHYFSHEMEEDARRILALEQDLSQIVDKGALKLHYLSKAGALTDTDKAHHAFPVYYQPKHRLSDRRMIGLESLVRWRHPILGMVTPNEFIHLAEETGYIHQISEWVIFQSCLQAVEWEREGLLPGRIAINISAVQLMHEGLAQDILKIIRRAEANPEWVEIEITETAVMHDPEIAARVMQELVDAGISISIDDFGTGHSSLAYLKRFPVDTLKIDKTFIRDLPDDADDLAIVRSIAAMAHALDIQVLAEGIEREAQLDLLTQSGCDLGQGFLFGRPSTAKELTKRLRLQRE